MIKTTNEFEIVNKSYKVDSHLCNSFTFSNTNFAGYLAEKEEVKTKDLQYKKEALLKEGKAKSQAYIREYKRKIEEKEKDKKLCSEKVMKYKESQKEYNKAIQMKVISKRKEDASVIVNVPLSKELSFERSIAGMGNSYYDSSLFNQDDNEKEPKPNIEVIKEMNTENESVTDKDQDQDNTIVDIKENIESMINMQQHIKSNKLNTGNPENDTENVFKKNLSNTTMYKQKEISHGIESIKDFRKRGLINMLEKENFKEEKTADEEEAPRDLQSHHQHKYARKFENSLHKQRYVKALKNLMIEKFSEKSIFIPSICSCGQLQKKLDTILEKGNISVLSIINTECANNCIYYNNGKDYQKALSDIISSIKNLKVESFVK